MTKEFKDFLSSCDGVKAANIIERDEIELTYKGTNIKYNLISMSMAIEIANSIVEKIKKLKKEHEELCEIEIQATIEYVILSVCTDLPIKDLTIDEFFKYRKFLPYKFLKDEDINIEIIEKTVIRKLNEAFNDASDMFKAIGDLAIQDMFKEEKDKETTIEDEDKNEEIKIIVKEVER